MTQQINSQQDFEKIKPQFETANSYKEFSKDYHFNPKLRIALTGMPVEEAVPKSKPGSPRRKIFEEMKNSYDGAPVGLVNSMTKNITENSSSKATKDADIFIAVYNGFIRLSDS